MPAQDRAGLAAIEHEVAEIERHCAELERSLVAGDWNAAGNALRSSRRSTRAFLDAMERCAGERDEEFDRRIHARMRRVFDMREDQLERLRVFRDGVGTRLQTLSRWKAFARSLGTKRAAPKSAGLDRRG